MSRQYLIRQFTRSRRPYFTLKWCGAKFELKYARSSLLSLSFYVKSILEIALLQLLTDSRCSDDRK